MAGPSGKELINEENFFAFVAKGQRYPIAGGAKTTASVNKTPQYAATTYSVADVLQGSFYEFNPQDQLMVINKALTDNLMNTYGSSEHIEGFSSFTSTLPSVSASSSSDSGSLVGYGTTGVGWPVGFPTEGAEAAALAAIQAGFKGDELLTAVMIAGRESSWKNVKSKVSNDWGMWQINGINLSSLTEIGVTDMSQLLDPALNARAAYVVYQRRGNTFDAWKASGNSSHPDVQKATGGKGFDPNGEALWNTSQFEEEARRAIESVTAKLSSGSLQFAGGTGVGATGTQISNTIDEFKYAGEKLINHPNFHAAHEGEWASGLRSHLLNGFTSGQSEPWKYIPAWFQSEGRGFYMPSLLNYLWYILESGFVIGQYLGGYGHRLKVGGSTLSNHALGGAMDFGKIGLEGQTPVPYQDPKWRTINDQLWQTMASYARSTKPEEVASTYGYTYGGWFQVYRDPNPTHIHLGFGPNQVGQLITALLPTRSGAVQSFR